MPGPPRRSDGRKISKASVLTLRRHVGDVAGRLDKPAWSSALTRSPRPAPSLSFLDILPSMRGNITLAGLLAELVGAELSFQRDDDLELATLAVAVLTLPGGRQVIAVERTYRDGIRVLLDPTPK